MPDAPVFSLESVNALVPRLNALLGEQMGRRGLIEAKLAALATLLDPVEGDTAETARIRAETRELVLEYQAGWEELEEMGAVVKDPRRGLLDFYGHVDGQLVWLCWQYGESEVSFYHGLEEGFPGRKAIETAAKQRLLN